MPATAISVNLARHLPSLPSSRQSATVHPIAARHAPGPPADPTGRRLARRPRRGWSRPVRWRCPVDPGYSPAVGTACPPVGRSIRDPAHRGGASWRSVGLPVRAAVLPTPGYSRHRPIPVEPPTEPPPIEPPTDEGNWVWAWSPQLGRWVWVKVPGEGEAGPKA